MTAGVITFDDARRRLLLRRSTKANDVIPIQGARGRAIGGAGMFQILTPIPALIGVLPAELPTSIKSRDLVLSITPRVDAQWGAAIGIATTQVSSMSYNVAGTGRRARQLKMILDQADISVGNWTGGWVPFIAKHVRDYLTTNNGGFFGITRVSGARGSKIIGIEHLPSIRCFRTGDPQFPVVYADRWGRQHLLKWYEVVAISDMTDPDDTLLGAGLCAAERAYQQIRKLAALEQYVYEKVSGSRPLAIYIVSGLGVRQLKKMMEEGFTQQADKGLSQFMGAMIMSTLKPDETPGLVTIPLAELPDGFQAEQERDRADLVYANAIGLDPQDLAPIGGERQLGVGSQSQTLADKAKGRGLAAYRVAMTNVMNLMVADNRSRFYFAESDYNDQERKAKISRLRSDFVNGLVNRKVITEEQGRQLLADWGEIPVAFLAPLTTAPDGTKIDITPVETLADADKPELLDAEASQQAAIQQVMSDLTEQQEETILQEALARMQNQQMQEEQEDEALDEAEPVSSPGPARSGGQGTSTIARVDIR